MKTTTHVSWRQQLLDSSLAVLLLLATAGPQAASALSLSNFQLITSSSVPINCILAYNQQLANCAISDFTQGGGSTQANGSSDGGAGETCSLACQASIVHTQQTIQAVCADGGIGTPATSVLGVALTGDLVGLLCGGAETVSPASDDGNDGGSGDDTTTTTVLQTFTPSPTEAVTAVPAVTAAATAATVSSNTLFFLTTFEPAALSIAATETTNGVAQAPAQQQQQPSPTPEVPASQSFIQSTSSRNGNGNAAPPSPTIATASVPQGTPTTQPALQSNNDGESRGGGSPFDAAVVNGAEPRRAAFSWTQPWVLAAAVGGGMLLR